MHFDLVHLGQDACLAVWVAGEGYVVIPYTNRLTRRKIIVEDEPEVNQQDGGVLGKRPRPVSTLKASSEQAKRALIAQRESSRSPEMTTRTRKLIKMTSPSFLPPRSRTAPTGSSRPPPNLKTY